MHCAACAITLQHELATLEGVVDAHVDYASTTARLHATGENVPARVADEASRVGYAASLREGK